MKPLFQDLRYSLRQLKASPGFSTTAILSLALGSAATTAVFSVLYAVVMNPYPYRAPHRIVQISLVDKNDQQGGFGLLTGILLDSGPPCVSPNPTCAESCRPEDAESPDASACAPPTTPPSPPRSRSRCSCLPALAHPSRAFGA